MASLASVYLGRANSVMILFVLTAVCESGSPLDIAALYNLILLTAGQWRRYNTGQA